MKRNDPRKGKRGSGDDSFNPVSKRHRKKNSHNKVLLTFLIVIVIAVILGLMLVVPMFTNKASTSALIKVPPGATEQNVEDSITKYLGKDYAHDVRQAMQIVCNEPLRHGAYLVEEGMSAMSAARKISTGGQSGVRLTFLGQRTKEDVARKVASKLDISADEMLKVMNDSVLLHKYRTDPDHVVALFLNDTYEFYWSATPEEIIAKMREHYDDFWGADNRYDKAEALRLSPRDVVALASIVDEETNKADEKGRVGRLYINRLNHDMKLQADPTVKFAIGDFTITRITNDMLQTESPYNTYRVAGVPPGPIRTTSAATIDAILNSTPTNDLYMCAKEDFSGYHNFAADYATHLDNARRYQNELDKRGIH